MLPGMAIRAFRIAAAELVSVWIGVAGVALTGDRDESLDPCVWIDWVTLLTSHCGMWPGQRIGFLMTGHIELRRFEMWPGVAFCAACVAVTELAAVRILMTALAHPRTPSVANCAGIRIPSFVGAVGDVALLAGHRHVLARERKPRGAMRKVRHRELCSRHGVAGVARRAQLPEMRIRVARRARGGRGHKAHALRCTGRRAGRRHGLHMTLRTCQRRVHPVKERSTVRMHERGDRKGLGRVARRARHAQFAAMSVDMT